MAYVKKRVNQTTFELEDGDVIEGDILNAEWLNYIQTQYDEFIAENELIIDGWYMCFFKLEVIPTGNSIQVSGGLIGNPVIYVDGTRHTSYEKSTGDTGTEDFYYTKGDDMIYAENKSIIGTTCEVYYYSLYPHESTHHSTGSDPLNVGDLGGLTEAEILALIPDYPDESEVTTINENIKTNTGYDVALVIRFLSDGYGENDELYDVGLV